MAKFSAIADNVHLTILLGAGASLPSGLPNWKEFARRVATISGLVTSTDAADILLSNQDVTIVLEAARKNAGTDWVRYLNEALYGVSEQGSEPSPLHLAVVDHFQKSSEKTTLSTLNFDVLLEIALAKTGEADVAVGFKGLEDPVTPTVHHLHGAIFNDSAYEPIVSFKDYANLMWDSEAWQHPFLSAALKRGPLLLAGTSYEDPDIRHWLHRIIKHERPVHPALVTIVREGLELSREEFATVEAALVLEWESIGLTALPLHDFVDVASVIRELQYVGLPEYRSPQERAQAVWKAHNGDFQALQSHYSEALASDASLISKALGTRAQRGTLWLANGNGMLARWASEGTEYRAVKYLKTVPTGHDSPWIAGEAIATEIVTFKDIERDKQAKPSWRAVLAIPILVGDGKSPDFASAVLTFGLSKTVNTILNRTGGLPSIVEELSTIWSNRLSQVAFPN